MLYLLYDFEVDIGSCTRTILNSYLCFFHTHLRITRWPAGTTEMTSSHRSSSCKMYNIYKLYFYNVYSIFLLYMYNFMYIVHTLYNNLNGSNLSLQPSVFRQWISTVFDLWPFFVGKKQHNIISLSVLHFPVMNGISLTTGVPNFKISIVFKYFIFLIHNCCRWF